MPDDGVISWINPLAGPGDASDAVAAAFLAAVNGLRPSDLVINRLYGASQRVVACLQARGLLSPHAGRWGSAVGGGAVGRCTAIQIEALPPTADLFLPLVSDADSETPAAALACLARAVVETGLGRAVPRPDGRAIVLRLEDLPIALLPVCRQGARLLVPGRDPEGLPQWVEHDPGAEVACLRRLDHLEGPRPRRLLCLLKAWRVRNRVPVSGYALEILVGAYFQSTRTPAGLPLLFEMFMAWARDALPGAFALPGASRRLFLGKGLQGATVSAYWRCVRARHLAASGEVGPASAVWRDLLGPVFPRLPETLPA
ncbi:hypothetical protein [Pararhodospirillum photometricum]|uniref:Uncharacterized protein n=1 Tax=Pararhodospirillum photometricum DSM 122 TaxID=1150469 RepID=H6SKM1_PARPM|nr:hypothetical protein [Pararhodospirillum photometricum]CCG08536.1 Putative uncharacterized protein [Pararhodospirillum photometricum DSM 122]